MTQQTSSPKRREWRVRIPRGYRDEDGLPYLYQSQVWNHRLDLLDDLWFGSRIERFKLHIEDRLFFWFLLDVMGVV